MDQAERFKKLLGEEKMKINGGPTGNSSDPVKITFSSGEELVVDKLFGYFTEPGGDGTHKTIVHGNFSLFHLKDVHTSINKKLENVVHAHIKKMVDGLAGSSMGVAVIELTPEIEELLRRKGGL